jgi:hypothetical protein
VPHEPVDGDGHEREDGHGDGEVGDEVVDGAVQRTEHPVSEMALIIRARCYNSVTIFAKICQIFWRL